MNGKNAFFYSALALGVAAAINSGAALAAAPVTPIQHVIVVVGENVTFDALFGAYKPAKGQTIKNLLSRGIINADGTPGPNFAKAMQLQASNPSDHYTARPVQGAPYATLPQPYQTGILDPATLQNVAPIADARFPADLPNGPFQITKYVPYGSAGSATGDPVHRFFQMWQQTGGTNRSHSLFTWVANTVGLGGDNGAGGPTAADSQQGGELMGFFNMSQGDAPIFKQLAQNYALSDNYHQAIMGGTGANFFSIATADVAVYNTNGVLTAPPANQIENPNPQAGTDNFYTQDGYAGGSYVNCSDANQPGVKSILRILNAHNRASNCANGAYYLVNNYDVPYNVDGTAKALGADKFVYPPQTVPTIGEALSAKDVSWKWYTAGRDANDLLNDDLYPTIHAYVNSLVPTYIPEPTRTQIVDSKTLDTMRAVVYNSIGDPHNASANVVNTPALRAHLQGMDSFLTDIDQETLPAVSFVVPKNLVSGHPGYSAPVRYELFINDLVAAVQAKPALWANTAIIVTTDEGGGYFDSGVIQNLDFFGDGPRIPLLVVSPYAKKGYVDHVYHDHASILKFIEYNWSLSPLSARSRDNLPNPVAGPNPYLPANQPAVGDLTSLFNFPK
ncbi:alkaline phosphatase family protein [Methylovulum psychrotolerans]|uniref:Phosphoesterase n=1 Tax=Methylovulum psychrotolerans TaxID=1704499 RepID=A0A2S5CPQ7_9GAMM|nr:alkaline phosphatase family protein [Methylovulum psychrotolerans]POZ52778.1 phosphoesterase [Methylovulum psychrotolerans]